VCDGRKLKINFHEYFTTGLTKTRDHEVILIKQDFVCGQMVEYTRYINDNALIKKKCEE
jgi:hypothetical protein